MLECLQCDSGHISVHYSAWSLKEYVFTFIEESVNTMLSNNYIVT